MKKLLIAILALGLWAGFLTAQDRSIKGQVLTPEKTPLEFANVFLTSDTTLSAGTLTDEEGNFELNVAAGEYLLTVSFVGIDDYRDTLNVSSDLNLGVVTMGDPNTLLDEVLVTEFRNELKAGFDKKVIPVSEELRRYNTNLSEILEMVPIVSMDMEGNPTIPGKSDVVVLVNGREPRIQANDMATVLRLIPSDQIVSIEIMTNPPAKYTKTNAAVINVVTKRDPQKGAIFNGWSRYSDLGALGAGGNFTMKNGKFSLSSWGGRWGWRSEAANTYERTNFNSDQFYRLSEDGEAKYNGYGFFGGISPEFQFDEKNILSLFVGGFSWNNENESLSEVNTYNKGEELVSSYSRDDFDFNSGGGAFAGIEYFKLFDEEEKEFNMELSMNVPFREIVREGRVISDEPFYQKITDEEWGWNLEFEMEYFDPIDSTSNINLEFEIEKEFPFDVNLDYISGPNEDETTLDESLSYHNTMELLFQDFSASYSKRFGNFGLNLDVGQAYINYNFLFDQINRVQKDYFFIVPKVSMMYKMGENGELGLNYKYGARPPRRTQLNPNITVSSDGLIERFGNPDLDAERSHEVEMNYGFYLGKFNIGATAFWRYSDNAVSSFVKVTNEGIQQSTYENNGQFMRTGGEVTLSGSIKKFMKINFNASLFDSRIDFVDRESLNTLSYQAGTNLSFFLPKDFIVSVSGDYNGPELLIQGEETGFVQLRGAIRKSFLKGKLNASLRFNDLFRTMEQTTTTGGNEFSAVADAIRRPAYFGVGLNVRFGQLKDMPKSNRAREAARG